MVAVGAPHHVTQRGNNRQRVFHSQQDYQVYLALRAERARQHECRILGYCPMPNHVHLVVIPDRSHALARALGQAHNAYSRYLNGRLARSGHLWLNRFYSAPLSRHHLVEALRYVDLNPVRAKLVDRAAEYRWSSAAAHLAGRDSSGLLDRCEWSKICPPAEWNGQLACSNEEEQWAERLRAATRHGRPWGDESFVRQISELAGRALRPRAHGHSGRNGSPATTVAGFVAAGG